MLKPVLLDRRDVSIEVFYACVRVMDVCDLDQRNLLRTAHSTDVNKFIFVDYRWSGAAASADGVYFWPRLM